MPSNELKCLEIILRHIITGSDLENEIKAESMSQETFNYTKGNLFNYLTIDSLLSNFNDHPNFSLQEFLYNGTITGKQIHVQTPSYDPRYNDNYKEFYEYLLEALKNDHYTFDDSNNIFVSSEKIETVVPREWLYCLSEFYKKSTYQRMFLFNKNMENDIVDKNTLLTYLYHTKTFIVTLESADPNIDYDALFTTAKINTEKELRGKKEIKVDEIIDLFKRNLPEGIKVNVAKYKISDATWLIPLAEKNNKEFYNKTLNEQKDDMNDWMISFINSNDKALEATQRLLPTLTIKNDLAYLKDKGNKNNIIIGLFNLYIQLLSKLGIDYQSISLTSFKIDTYMDEDFQDNINRLHELVKLINTETEKKEMIDETINIILANLDDVSEQKLTELEAEYSAYLSERQISEITLEKLKKERNKLMSENHEKRESQIEELAFDNDQIIYLILKSIQQGRVYINAYNKNRLTIELHNDEIGKTTFQASISLDNLLLFIENNNYGIDTYTLPLR